MFKKMPKILPYQNGELVCTGTRRVVEEVARFHKCPGDKNLRVSVMSHFSGRKYSWPPSAAIKNKAGSAYFKLIREL